MPRRPADGLGTQLRRLVELLDGDLDEIYAEDGLGYRSRYSPIMRALHDGVPRTIKQIAALSTVSHSAASQTVSRMMAEGMVAQRVGADARERLVHLTPKGRRLVPTLKARWRAADVAAAGLEKELGVKLQAVLGRAISILEARSFKSRILAAMPKRRARLLTAVPSSPD